MALLSAQSEVQNRRLAVAVSPPPDRPCSFEEHSNHVDRSAGQRQSPVHGMALRLLNDRRRPPANFLVERRS